MNSLTKGSRFYFYSPFVLLMTFGLALYLKDSTGWIAVATTWMALAGAKSAVGTHKGNGA